MSTGRSGKLVPDEEMKLYAVSLWVLGLFVLCITGTALSSAAAGASEHWQENLIYGFGGGIPLFVATTLGWMIGYLVTRDMKKALWTWTAIIVVALSFLGVALRLLP